VPDEPSTLMLEDFDLFPQCRKPRAVFLSWIGDDADEWEQPCLAPVLPGVGGPRCMLGHVCTDRGDRAAAEAEMRALERRGGVLVRGLVAGWRPGDTVEVRVVRRAGPPEAA
jgi:hypothetical protein